MKQSIKIEEKINYLTLKEITGSKNGKRFGNFECECGTIKNIVLTAVKSGDTKSCGCHRKKNCAFLGQKAKTHGLTGTWLHTHWLSYYNQDLLCEDWKDFQTFSKDIGYLLSSGKRLIKLIDDKPLSIFNCKIVSSLESKEKHRKATCLDKYGVESHTQLESIKEKIKQTNIEKYGFSNPLQSKEIKEKGKQTCLKKYSVDHYTKTDEYKEAARQRTIDNGQAFVYQGKTGTQWAQELGFAHATIHTRIKKHGVETAISLPKYQSSIESIMEQVLIELNINFTKQKAIENYFADFVLDDFNIIIECDGLYWHSDKKKDDLYHKNKKDIYNKNKYKSFFFRENEIDYKLNIVKSIISNAIGLSNKIYARKCIVKNLDIDTRKTFFETNHLMGVNKGKAVGLYYNEELICGLQYLTKNNIMNIERFCPKINYNIIGGFSRLLKYATQDDNPNSIQTFIDLRYGNGSYLTDLGFKLESSHPSFVWCKDDKTFHRMKFPSNTGYEQGYCKVWDCGQAKWTKQL